MAAPCTGIWRPDSGYCALEVHCFFLEHLPNNGWQCYWWLKGAAADGAPEDRPQSKSVWSADSKVALAKINGEAQSTPTHVTIPTLQMDI